LGYFVKVTEALSLTLTTIYFSWQKGTIFLSVFIFSLIAQPPLINRFWIAVATDCVLTHETGEDLFAVMAME